MGRYRVLEEVALADCALEIDGTTPADVFATAARALAELMVDPATLPTTVRRHVALEAEALDLLLHDWLAELIFRKDRDGEVYPEAHVEVREGTPCALVADVAGGVLDATAVALRADPKAVTFHQFALERTPDGWRARVVIDI